MAGNLAQVEPLKLMKMLSRDFTIRKDIGNLVRVVRVQRHPVKHNWPNLRLVERVSDFRSL